MRTIRGSLALLAVAVAAVLAGQFLNSAPTSAAPAQLPLQVKEQNLDLAGRIQVSLPNVDENGRLLVAVPPEEQPERYEHFAHGVNSFEFGDCKELPIPDGQRLELRFVSIQMANASTVEPKHADFLTGTLVIDGPGNTSQVVPIPLMFNGIPYIAGNGYREKGGFTEVLAFGDSQIGLSICQINDSGSLVPVIYDVYASGWLHDE